MSGSDWLKQKCAIVAKMSGFDWLKQWCAIVAKIFICSTHACNARVEAIWTAHLCYLCVIYILIDISIFGIGSASSAAAQLCISLPLLFSWHSASLSQIKRSTPSTLRFEYRLPLFHWHWSGTRWYLFNFKTLNNVILLISPRGGSNYLLPALPALNSRK